MAETSELLNGVVEGVTTFGAFVKLEDGRKGLVHISEVARGYVKDINEHLAVGDEVTVKLLDEDENGRLRLSIRQALPPEPPRQSKAEPFPKAIGGTAVGCKAQYSEKEWRQRPPVKTARPTWRFFRKEDSREKGMGCH